MEFEAWNLFAPLDTKKTDHLAGDNPLVSADGCVSADLVSDGVCDLDSVYWNLV